MICALDFSGASLLRESLQTEEPFAVESSLVHHIEPPSLSYTTHLALFVAFESKRSSSSAAAALNIT